MHVTRLAEVLGFAVSQFVSGKAHRALQRVAASRPMAHQLRLREAHLLQPLAGVLLALWQAEQDWAAQAALAEQAGQGGAAAPQRRQSLMRALGRQAALSDEVLRGLLEAEVSCEGLAGCWPAPPPAASAGLNRRRPSHPRCSCTRPSHLSAMPAPPPPQRRAACPPPSSAAATSVSCSSSAPPSARCWTSERRHAAGAVRQVAPPTWRRRQTSFWTPSSPHSCRHVWRVQGRAMATTRHRWDSPRRRCLPFLAHCSLPACMVTSRFLALSLSAHTARRTQWYCPTPR